MAKRNQVTTDLQISADAQLKSSRGFINQLNKIIDKFDFGDKINNQLTGAIGQLKNYNKVLEKVQNKSVISDDELKDLVKAGKEIANIVSKTEKLYSNLNTNELNKFSKEYIAKIKAQEEAVAKIKNDYAARTGKNFNKELANYDKLSARVKALEKEKANLIKNGANQIVEKEIDEINKKLETQKTKLKEIQKLQAASSNAYSSTLEKETKKRGYNSFDDLKGVRAQSEEQIRKRLGNAEYKQQSNLLSEINREIKDIEKSKLESNKADKAAISLAKKYKIENVATLNDLKEQVKLKKNNLNQFKNNKSELANAKQVTVELNRQNKLLEDREAIVNAAKQAELKVIQTGSDYKTKASLTAGASATNRQINTLESQLTDAGIEQIANNAANIVANQLSKISGEISKGNQDLAGIDETNKKLATQSERTADELDIKEGTSQQIKATNEDGKETRRQLGAKIDTLKPEDIQRIFNSQKSLRFSEMATNSLFADGQYDINSATYKTILGNDGKPGYEGKIADLEGKIESLSKIQDKMQLKTYTEQIIHDIEEVQRTADTVLNNALNEIDIKAKEYKDYLETMSHKKGARNESTKAKISMANEYLRTKDENKDYLVAAHALAQGDLEKQKRNLQGILTEKTEIKTPANIEFPNTSNQINKLANDIQKAAEQSQYLGSTFDDLKNKVGYFLSMNYVFDQMTRKISQAVQTVKEMDKDMTQIGLVLGKTSGQVWRNFDTYSKMAERLNTTTSEVTNSMKLFYQQGLNTAEVNKMVEASAIAAALGESTMAEASETLTSIINSYNLSATQAMEVTDKISQIAIVSAADFGELSTAIEKVASSAASAGLDLDHMMGYLAKMIETTREAPTNIGTALKTIVANFTQFKEDPSQLGIEGSEINKVDKALKSVNINLADSTGEVRDLSEVLDELGSKWDTLTRSQKSYLATQIAGTRQQSRFYALMNDYDRTLELVAEGSNSAGKAQQQFALYSNSLEASTSRLTNQWQKFFNNITKGNGSLVLFNNALTQLMKLLNLIGPLKSALGLVSFTSSLKKSINLFNNLNERLKENQELKNNFNQKVQYIKDNKDYTEDEKRKKIGDLRNEKDEINFNNAKFFENAGKSAKQYVKRINDISKQHAIIDRAININSKSFTKFKKKLNDYSSGIKKFAAGANFGLKEIGKTALKVTAQIAAMALLQIAFKAVGSAIEGIKDSLGAATEKYVELAEKSKENASTIQGLREEYEALSKKLVLTEEEQKRLNEITEEASEVDAKLGAQLKANGNQYKKNIELMKQYEKQEKRNAAIQSNKALLSDSNIINNFPFFSGDWWSEQFAKLKNDKNTLNTMAETEYVDWRSAIQNQAVIGDLDSDKTRLLNVYGENLINQSKANETDPYAIKVRTENFIKKLEEFTEKLKNLTDFQGKEYIKIANMYQDGTKSYQDIWSEIANSTLPSEIKKQLYEEATDKWYQTRTNILDTNNFIQTNEGKQAIGRITQNAPKEFIDKLFSPENIEILSEGEKAQLQQQIGNIFNDEKIRNELEDAVFEGQEAINKFIKELSNSDFGFLKEVYQGLISLEASIEKTKQAFERLQEKMDNSFLTGKASQVDIIKGILENTLDIRDVKSMQGATGNILSIDITRQIAQIDSYIKQIESTFDVKIEQMQKDIDKYTPKTETKSISMSGGRDNIGTETTTTYGFIEEKKAVTYDNQLELAYQKKLLEDYEKQKQEKTTQITNKEQELTNRAGGDKEGSYMTASKDELEELKKWKSEETELQNKIDITNNTISTQEKVVNKLKEEQEGYNKLQKGLENNEDGLRDSLEQTVETLKAEQQQVINTKNAITEYLERKTKNQKENTTVFNEYSNFNQIINELSLMKDAYQATDGSIEGMISTINLLTSNSELADYLDETVDYTKFSQQAIQDASQSMITAKMNNLDAEIAATEATISLIENRIAGQQAEVKGEQEKSEGIKTEIGKVLSYEDSQTKAMSATTQSESQSIEMSIANWATWSTQAQTAIQEVSAKFAEYVKKRNEESEESVSAPETKVTISGIKGNTGKDTGLTEEQYKSNADSFINTLNSKDINNTEDLNWLNGRLDMYKKQLVRLKALRGTYSQLQKGLGGYLKGDNSKGGGNSKDKEFDPILEKLEHFYNYLRQIEKIESKLNKLAEKRNLIDANNNYYIDDLKTENELLKEQQDLYTNYIRDEGEYLAQLRDELKGSAYGDKVYFDEDGLIQVNQTEFSANSEEEQEKLQAFMDLVNEYQNEYNTKLENENKLIQIQVQQLENVKKMYEKVLKRIQDVTTEIERQIELTEHTATMDFSEINQIDYLNTKGGQNVSGILYSETEIAKLQKEIDGINKSVKGLPYSELLEWDEALQQWNVNESKMNDPAIKAKYEALGYTWDQIETSVRSTVTSSQQLNNNLKETVSQANKFRENLKQVLEDSIAGIKDFFSNATDAINGYFSQIERAMDEIDNSNDMFGVDSESLENKYKTLVQSTILIKQLVEELRRDQKNTENALTKDFASYVTFINGVAVMNEQAVNNSKTLTKQQQAELKRLIAAYNSAEEQIEELGDKEVEYFQKMLEMEEAKRDAIIELKQQVHDELMARDQEEIDSLQSKYDKMNQLDNEYYNKLQQRVNDARTLREDRQQDNNIAQMQARVSLLQSANGSQYNSELVELQKQLNEALQTQADNDVNRELERIQREQQERQEDRALTISAMENVLTFKDENNWYWQEAQRIWSEGPESITGYLQSSREYMNISDEQRAQSFENLTTSMNTAFTTLATAEGVTAATSAGTVSNAVNELNNSVTSSLNWVNQQLGSAGVIYSSLTNINGGIGNLETNLPESFRSKMQDLYGTHIGPGIDATKKAITDYLGENSKLVKTTKSIIDGINAEGGLKTTTKTGLDKIYDALMGKNNGPMSVISQTIEEIGKFLSFDTRIFKYLDKEVAKKEAEEAAKNAKPVTTPPVAKPNPTPTPNTNSPIVNKPKAGSGNGVPEIGDTVKLTGGIFYSQSSGHGDKGNLQNAWTGKQVKITHMNNGAPYPIHISTLGGSALGWLRKEQLSGYRKGGYVDYTGLANVHGTSANPEAFLNAKQTALFETLRDALVKGANPKTYDNNKEVSKEEYNIGNVNIEVKEIAETNEIEKITKRVKEEIYRDATGHNNMAIRRR